jgi:hypothetical protein
MEQNASNQTLFMQSEFIVTFLEAFNPTPCISLPSKTTDLDPI